MKALFSSIARPLALLAIAAMPSIASAQSTMTFAPVACSTGLFNNEGTSYTESGFTIAGANLATLCADYPGNSYAGDNLLINTIGVQVSLTKVGGGLFSLNSIDLAALFPNSGAQALTFTGNVSGGTQVFQTFNVSASGDAVSFENFDFAPEFSNLTSVDFAAQNDPYYQFADVELDAVAAPEPASLALVATGMIGMLGVARRKKRA